MHLERVTRPEDLRGLTGSELDELATEIRDFVVDALNDIPGISCPVPKGAFYAFPSFDFPDVTAQELADYLLEDARVALLPGTDFGAASERHLRLSYVGELSDLREAMARIKTSLAKRFPDFV